MRLSAIHLHGFKSFCDRATVQVKEGLTGIVGPNGCGKSNIIDALRWGLGESRAASLRGGALQDVLFNGSGRRPPADSCAVEMIFSAQDGDDLGMWKGATQIAIKRELARDGQSYFYINNQSARRRDVVALFRGTGVSPRSYAVVEQGMVGGIAEASPDELRQFLEETAGVSHYKDSRRDSERRLASCRANLEQLAALLADLQKRADSLKRQARAANRHRELNVAINDMEVLLIMQKRENAKRLLAAKEKEIDSLEGDSSAGRAKLDSLKNSGEELRRRRADLQKEAQKHESEWMRAQADLERLRRDRDQAEQKRAQMQEQLAADKGEQADIGRGLQECERERNDSAKELEGIGGELERRIADCERQADEMETLQEAVRSSGSETEAARKTLHDAERRRETANVRANIAREQKKSLQARLDELRGALQNLQKEEDAAPPSADDSEKQAALLESALQEREDTRKQLAEETDSAAAAVHAAEKSQAAAESERAALRAMDSRGEWQNAPPQRLADRLQADAGDWARALDAALGRYAESFAAESLDEFLSQNGLPPAGAGVVEMPAADSDSEFQSDESGQGDSDSKMTPLLSLIKSPPSARPFLAARLRGVFAADNEDEARAARARLGEGEILITRGGVVFAKDAVFAAGEARGGFNFQQRLAALEKLIRANGEQLSAAQRRLQELQARGDSAEKAREKAAEELSAARGELAERRIAMERWRERRRAAEGRRAELENDIAGAESLLQAAEADIARQDGGRADRDEGEKAAAALSAAQASAAAAAQELEVKRGEFHQSNLARRELHMREENLKNAINSLSGRAEELQRRREALAARLARGEKELAQLSDSALAERLTAGDADSSRLQKRAQDSAAAVAAIDQDIAAADRKREKELEAMQQLQERNTQLQVEKRELALTAEGLDNSLEDYAVDETRLAALREQEKSEEEWRAEMETLRGRRERLGAINFAADREFSEIGEQLQTAGAQKEDVEQAAEELQKTIRRIDDDTRARMRRVYEAINKDFGGLFKRLFGGGEAQLMMEGDSFLDAQFEIRARPPGKRMFPVRMLSGGEKTATALAFIFTLMRQTPPPFCIMDEVDATLDDSRADAFIALLGEMARDFQCLVVSHNKSTVEAMRHLIGVTQEEKGVSKIVTVTLADALESASIN